MKVIESERLVIREFSEADFDNLYGLLSDPEVMKYCSGNLDKEGTQKWLSSVIKYYENYGYDYWAVTDKTTDVFIGQAGIIKQEVDNEWINCLAFMISKNMWGKGYATEVAKSCITYGFNNLGLKELYATVEPENVGSISVLMKTGMNYEKDVICFDEDALLYVIRSN